MTLLLLLACGPATVELAGHDSGVPTGDSTPTTTVPGDDTATLPTDSTPTTTVPAWDPGLVLEVDGEMVLMVHATWTSAGADEWIEYRWEDEVWLEAPRTATGEAVLLGIPAETTVEARVGHRVDGDVGYGPSASAVTGELPSEVLEPSVDAWDPALADEAGYGMISVATGDYTYSGPYLIEIFDRSGRVVWYHEVPAQMFSFYPSVAFDGTHIWFEAENIFGMGRAAPSVTRRTLDGRWETTLEVDDLGQAIAEGPDGSFFYELRGRRDVALHRIDAAGTTELVWDCAAWMSEHGQHSSACYMNTCNWDPDRNTVLASMFESDTVFEVDVATGAPIRQMGQLTVGEPWTFSPSESMFDYQHGPLWTADGTLLVSTHVRGRSGVQVAAEYTLDDATQTLTRVWSYTSTDMWATQVGEAIPVRNGNVIQGYGQDGGVREVTREGEVAWQATWEKDAYGYRVVGHFTLIDDLYALNRGPE